jgi:hypothetical protein
VATFQGTNQHNLFLSSEVFKQPLPTIVLVLTALTALQETEY